MRLLYHRVVAPTEGVLGWAAGDSLSFDLVFTGVESMAASDVLGLVKVSKNMFIPPLPSRVVITCTTNAFWDFVLLFAVGSVVVYTIVSMFVVREACHKVCLLCLLLVICPCVDIIP